MSARKRLKKISFYADKDAKRDYAQGKLTHVKPAEFRESVAMWAQEFAESHVYQGLTKKAVADSYATHYTWMWCQCRREQKVSL